MWSLGKLFTVDTTDMKEHVCVWMQAAGWLSSVGNSLVLGLSGLFLDYLPQQYREMLPSIFWRNMSAMSNTRHTAEPWETLSLSNISCGGLGQSQRITRPAAFLSGGC